MVANDGERGLYESERFVLLLVLVLVLGHLLFFVGRGRFCAMRVGSGR